MSRQWIDIGPTPADEPCEQAGPQYQAVKAVAECKIFERQLRRQLGDEPGTAELRVKSQSHDFGTYHEVVCYFDDTDEVGMEYAFKCENESPAKWDDIAKQELAAL